LKESNNISIYRSKKAYDYGLASLAFLIPLISRGLPLVILGAAILGVFYYVIAYRKVGKEKKDYVFLPYNLLNDSFSNILKNRNTHLLMVCFFFYYLLSVLYSDNKDVAWTGVILKSSFLYFPILFSLTKWDLEKTKRVFDFFILGCLVNLILSYLFVFIEVEGPLAIKDFTHMSLSFSFHPSYIAMYVNLALILNSIILFSKSFTESRTVVILRWALQFLFCIFVIMLSSRAGLLTWFTTIGCIILYIVFIQRTFLKSLIFVSAVSVLFLFSFNKLSILGGRMSESVETMVNSDYKDKTGEYNSTGTRVGIWTASYEVFLESPIIGAGIGDAKSNLVKKFKEKGMTVFYDAKFNSHNQFLDTSLALGGIGLFLMVVIILSGFVNYGKITVFTFGIMGIISGSLFVESMLERQAGAVFIAWVIALAVSVRPVMKSLK
jgi:hypothetical protein